MERKSGGSQESQPKTRKKRKLFDSEEMEAAITQYKQEVESGKTPIFRHLAKTWNVPRSTLQRRVRRRGLKVQPVSVLKVSMPPEAEEDLVNTLISLSQQGVPLRPSNIRSVVFHFAKTKGIPGFSDEKDKAGLCWLKSFLSRNSFVLSKISKSTSCIDNTSLETTEVDEKVESSNGERPAEPQNATCMIDFHTWCEESMDVSINQYKTEHDSETNDVLRVQKVENRTEQCDQKQPKARTRKLQKLRHEENMNQNQEDGDSEGKPNLCLSEYMFNVPKLQSPRRTCLGPPGVEQDNNEMAQIPSTDHEKTSPNQEEQTKATKSRQFNKWSEEKMKSAINEYQQELNSGKVPSIRKLARYWNVPKATLQRRVKGVVSGFQHVVTGRKTFFPPEAERDLENSLVSLATEGFPLTPNEIRMLAYQYAKENGIPGFSDEKEKAGAYWYKGFMKRHPRLRTMLSKDPSNGNCSKIEMGEFKEQKTMEKHEMIKHKTSQSQQNKPRILEMKTINSRNEETEAALLKNLQKIKSVNKAKVRLLARTASKKALLPFEAEKDLANSIILMAEQGSPPTATEVRIMAFKYAKQKGIPGFSQTQGRAGLYWLKGFIKRNSKMCHSISHGFSNVSCSCSLATEMVEQEIVDNAEDIDNDHEQGQDEQPKATKQKQLNTWNEEGMEAALTQYQQELEAGIKPKMRLLARIWKIPRTTLQRRLKNGVSGFCPLGRKVIIPSEAEKDLVKTLESLSEMGVPLTATVVRTMAFQYAKANDIPGFSETQEKAGFYWLKGFMKRNPNLRIQVQDHSKVNRGCGPIESTEMQEQMPGECEEIDNVEGLGQEEQAKKKKQVNTWSEDRMEAAINQYQQELASGKKPILRSLAKCWNVPRSTLQRRVKGVVIGSRYALGKKALLTPEAEKDLATTLLSLSKQGFPVTSSIIQTMAVHYARANGIPGFSEDKKKAGFHWLKGFMKRNPEIAATDSGEVANILEQQNYESLITILGIKDGPSHIWCCDEIDLENNNFFVQISQHSQHSQSSDEIPERVSILSGCNALGAFSPTMVIFKERTFQDSFLYSSNNDVFARSSENGSITAEFLKEWGQEFVSNLPKDDPLPHLLLMYGPSSRLVTADLLKYLNQHNVYVMSCSVQTSQQFPTPHQVLFKCLQENWSIAAIEWNRDTFGMAMSKVIFFSLFLEAWKKSSTIENVEVGFRDSGLYPVMKNVYVNGMIL